MRVKRLLKFVGLSLLGLTILVLLSILAFVFNPLEGSLPNMRDVVPRNIDFFFRKQNLKDDFSQFPEPVFWEDLTASPTWRQLRGLPLYKDLTRDGSIERAVVDARRIVADLKASRLDLLADAIGREVLLAGRMAGNTLDGSTVCIYTRVSWKVRAAWGLMRYGFIQDQVRNQGVQVQFEDDILVIQPQGGGKPIFASRHLDCLLIGTDRELLQTSLNIARGVPGEVFGTSSTYLEGIDRPIRDWKRLAEFDDAHVPNVLEFFADTQKLFQRTTFDDNWPNPAAKDSMNERVLASFLNLQGWKFLTGSLVFEPGNREWESSLTLLAQVAMNINLQTPFQRNFFRAEEQNRREWLNPFLAMVPKDAFAACGMRMPAGDFLREMYRAMDRDEQDLLNQLLRSTGAYQTVLDLIDKVEIALLPRTGFVFRRNLPDPEIPVSLPSPVPQVAWVFWLRPGQRKIMDDLLAFMRTNHRVLKFDKMYANPIVDARGDAVSEFTNPQIPGTGMIAGIVFDEFFVLGNSGPLIRDLFKTRLGRMPSILERGGDLEEFNREIPNTVNGFVYLQGRPLEELLNQYDRHIAEGSSLPDPGWMIEKRPGMEMEVFRGKYDREAASIAGLSPQLREQFNNDVTARLTELWSRERGTIEAQSRAGILQALAFTRMFRSMYLQVTLDAESIRMSGRAKVQYR